MEKKLRDSSCSEDVFKAQQRGTWATLGMSDSFGTGLASISNSSGPGDEAHLLGDAPAQPPVIYRVKVLSRLSQIYGNTDKVFNFIFNYSFSVVTSIRLLSTFPCPICTSSLHSRRQG